MVLVPPSLSVGWFGPNTLLGQGYCRFFYGSGYRSHKNLFCSGAQENASALTRSGAGGHNVIHQQDGLSLNALRLTHSERSAQVKTALMTRQASLRRRIADAHQRTRIQFDARRTLAAHKSYRNRLRLVETTVPALALGQRHRNHQQLCRKRRRRQGLLQED